MAATATPQFDQRRLLNVHEHVSFSVLQKNNIPVPGFGVASTSEEAREIAVSLDSTDVVVKAQVQRQCRIELSKSLMKI